MLLYEFFRKYCRRSDYNRFFSYRMLILKTDSFALNLVKCSIESYPY